MILYVKAENMYMYMDQKCSNHDFPGPTPDSMTFQASKKVEFLLSQDQRQDPRHRLLSLGS